MTASGDLNTVGKDARPSLLVDLSANLRLAETHERALHSNIAAWSVIGSVFPHNRKKIGNHGRRRYRSRT
jgi:hypothetical protein